MIDAEVAIIIVNFRTPQLVVDCLESLAADASNDRRDVVVVENGSGDDSMDVLRDVIAQRGWDDWVRVVKSEKNLGFAGGNNLGIRSVLRQAVPPKFIWLLNPDTIVMPQAQNALVSFLNEHPGTGIVGSQIENTDGQLENSAHRFPTPISELDSSARLGIVSRWLQKYRVSIPHSDQSIQCDWVSGASLMIRREAVEQAGLLDEGYFLYFEEVDLCAQAKQAGWDCWHVPGSRVVHLEGASTGIQRRRARRGKYWYDSRRRFFLKMYALRGLIAADVLWALGRLSFLIRRCLFLAHNAGGDPKYFALDLLWGDFVALARGRASSASLKESVRAEATGS